MGIKVHISEVEKRLASRGISVIEYAGIISGVSLFKCSKGHVWKTTANSVVHGYGCPHCAGQARLSFEDAQKRLEERAIAILEWSGGTVKKAKFQCKKCSHIWESNMGNVLHGNGCRKCAGLLKRTIEDVNNEISHRGLECIFYAGTVAKKSKFKCNCGNVFEAQYNSITQGRGCPSCAKYGYNVSAPAWLYFLQIENITDGKFIGFGVTRNYKSRMVSHRMSLKKSASSHVELAKFYFESGKIALQAEKELKKLMEIYDFKCNVKGFVTEALPTKTLTKALEIVSEYITAK